MLCGLVFCYLVCLLRFIWLFVGGFVGELVLDLLCLFSVLFRCFEFWIVVLDCDFGLMFDC